MDTLEALAVTVAETGSLSAAARELLKQAFVVKFLDGRQRHSIGVALSGVPK